jgi:multidrug resistance efflux pump
LAGIQNLAYAKKKEVADLAKDIEGKMPNCGGGDVCRRVKKRVRRALKHLYDRLNTLVSQASASADQLNKTNAAIAAYSQTIASWSDQALQGAQKTALEASAKARSTAGELKAKAERLQANREKAREHLKVWRS